MSEIMVSLTEEHGADRLWTERELQGSALRITDLEKIVGEPVGDLHHAPSVHSSQPHIIHDPTIEG